MKASAAGRSVAVCFVTLGLAYGVWYAYSVFLVALLREFGWSRSLVAGAFSVFTLVHGVLGPPLGWLVERLGPRRVIATGGVLLGVALLLDSAIARPWHLYAGFGVLTSLGVSLSGWVPTVILVRRWFPARMGTAIGLVSAGTGVGIFLVVPACQWLIDLVGWRWAFRILGLASLGWVLPATLGLVRDPPAGEGTVVAAVPARPEEGELTLRRAMAAPPFWLLGTLQACTAFTSQLLLVHHVAYLVDHGIPALIGASVVGLVGAASIVGKIGGGWASDHIGRPLTYTIGLGALMAGIGVLALVGLRPSPALAYVYGAVIGIGYAIPAAITPALISDVFRTRHFGAIFGALLVSSAVGGSLGPWVAGRIFDATGSYGPALVVAAAATAAGVTALWLSRRGAPA